ncbi:MAG: hypothetical protein OEU36_07520 [Gammaproteobacteria bacterium]|nr:hypothetical protein [Gammaproteobacteria bacterium]
MNRHLFDNRLNIARLLRWFYLICAALLLLDFIYHRHITHQIEAILGFYGLYGFVSCVVLVLAAKALRKFIMRSQSYYDSD